MLAQDERQQAKRRRMTFQAPTTPPAVALALLPQLCPAVFNVAMGVKSGGAHFVLPVCVVVSVVVGEKRRKSKDKSKA